MANVNTATIAKLIGVPRGVFFSWVDLGLITFSRSNGVLQFSDVGILRDQSRGRLPEEPSFVRLNDPGA